MRIGASTPYRTWHRPRTRAYTRHRVPTCQRLRTSTAMQTCTTDPKHLAPTPVIQSSDPRIRRLAEEITQGASSKREEAVRIHDFVRDRILFGIPSSFYESTATEVLDAGVGYCNTKTTLFSALLRARGIPTRTKMMDLNAAVLRGLFDPRTAYVDHAITEVWLDDRWMQIDSYVVDKTLADEARRLLAKEAAASGYGVHTAGRSDWEGTGDSLIQCVIGLNGVSADYIGKCHGYFDDVIGFYATMPEARNRKTLVNRVALWLMAASITADIDKVRKGTKM